MGQHLFLNMIPQQFHGWNRTKSLVRSGHEGGVWCFVMGPPNALKRVLGPLLHLRPFAKFIANMREWIQYKGPELLLTLN
jgi:hypothetical protein